MPHLILEYTSNVQEIAFKELLPRLHDALSEVGDVEIGNCKSRAIKLKDYNVAGGDAREAFVHLGVSILEGRSQEWKQGMGKHFLGILREAYAQSSERLNLQISVEIRDIQSHGYFKIPELRQT